MSSKGPDTAGASQVTADASIKAANIQAQSEAENRALQERLYNQQLEYLKTQDVYNQGITAQNQANFQPYIDSGKQGLGLLTNEITDPNSQLNSKFDASSLANDPGYQFRLSQGQNTLNNSLAAKGGLLSGAALKATDQFSQGLASDEYNNAYQRFTNDKSNRYSMLSGLANYGLQGATGFAGGSPQSTSGSQLANITGQYGNTLGSIISNGANNQSNITMAAANAQAQLLASGGKSGGGVGGALSGAMSGAATGAAIGSVVPGIGTAFGAIGGGIIGGLSTML